MRRFYNEVQQFWNEPIGGELGPDADYLRLGAEAFPTGLLRIGADIGHGAVPSFIPDIVHAHDWQAGLTLAYLHYSNRQRRPATVMPEGAGPCMED